MLSHSSIHSTGGNVRFLSPSGPVAPTSQTGCTVYNFEVRGLIQGASRSYSDFDDLVSALEKDETAALQLREGRSWVGSTFYGGGHPTLASLRLAAGLSQRQLGEACGLEQPHVSRYESGKHEPSLTTAVRMARALGVDLEKFSGAWEATRAEVQTGG